MTKFGRNAIVIKANEKKPWLNVVEQVFTAIVFIMLILSIIFSYVLREQMGDYWLWHGIFNACLYFIGPVCLYIPVFIILGLKKIKTFFDYVYFGFLLSPLNVAAALAEMPSGAGQNILDVLAYLLTR